MMSSSIINYFNSGKFNFRDIELSDTYNNIYIDIYRFDNEKIVFSLENYEEQGSECLSSIDDIAIWVPYNYQTKIKNFKEMVYWNTILLYYNQNVYYRTLYARI